MESAAITGAASGIGRALALEAAARGAPRLWLVDLSAPGLADVVRELPNGYDAQPKAIDLRSRVDITNLAQDWSDEGPPHLLVNCAGTRSIAAVGATTDEDWDDTIAVNLTAPFLMTRAASNAMRQHGVAGVIVNIASTAAEIGYTDRSAYCASKAGVLGLTRSAALDLAPDGIRVFAVSPGFHHTGLSRDADDAAVVSQVPLGRRGDPAELAKLILDLAGSSFVTGSNIVVDGGALAGHRV